MRPRLLVTALGFAVRAALSAGTGAAQSSPPCHRCLDGFRFVPSSVVDEPFINTSFENATGGGMALNLKVPAVRIVAPLPGRNTVGIEVPNEIRQTVQLKELVAALGADEGVKLVDDPERNYFPMPKDASGQDPILVGRIRQDLSDPSGRERFS